MIDYSIEYQDIRGHIAERLYGKQYNKFCKQPRPKMQRYASEMKKQPARVQAVTSKLKLLSAICSANAMKSAKMSL